MNAERFRPRFVASARKRLAAAREDLSADDPVRLLRELHTLVGDAGILQLHDLASAVRAAEELARGWERERTPDRQAACAQALADLAVRVEALA